MSGRNQLGDNGEKPVDKNGANFRLKTFDILSILA